MPKKNKDIANKNKNKVIEDRGLLLKFEGTLYGTVTKVLGNCMFTVFCYDGIDRLCAVRKIKKKKPQVSLDDVVLVGTRDFQDNKGDIVFVYNLNEVKKLRELHEIPSDAGRKTGFSTENDFEETVEEIPFSFDEI
jgi:translation initiation factor 1A